MASSCVRTALPPERCLELPPAAGPAVAKVGEVSLTVDEVVARLRAQGTASARRHADQAKLREFVEDQIRFELLARAARERGLANDPDVVDAARKVMVRKLLLADLGPVTFANAEVADAAIAAYYDKHKDQYQQPEKRRIAHVQLAPTPAGKALADSLLAKLRAHPEDKNQLRTLAARHSLDPETRQVGGEVPFTTYDEMEATYGPTFAGKVFAAAPGALIDTALQSTRGWHLVRVVSQREALTRSLDEVGEDIRERLLKTQRAEVFERYLQSLRERYPVALYEEHLAEVLARLTTDEAEGSP